MKVEYSASRMSVRLMRELMIDLSAYIHGECEGKGREEREGKRRKEKRRRKKIGKKRDVRAELCDLCLFKKHRTELLTGYIWQSYDSLSCRWLDCKHRMS